MTGKAPVFGAQFWERMPLKVLDWDAVARHIVDNDIAHAAAGLIHSEGVDYWAVGDILENGEPIPEDMTYLAVASAVRDPALFIGADQPIPMWVYEGEARLRWPECDDLSTLYWPESAVTILREGKKARSRG